MAPAEASLGRGEFRHSGAAHGGTLALWMVTGVSGCRRTVLRRLGVADFGAVTLRHSLSARGFRSNNRVNIWGAHSVLDDWCFYLPPLCTRSPGVARTLGPRMET